MSPQLYDKAQVKQVADALRETQVTDALANDMLVRNAQRTLERAQAKLEQETTLRDNLHLDPNYHRWNLAQKAFMGDAAYTAVATAQSLLDLAHNEYDQALRDYHKRTSAQRTAEKEAEQQKKFEAEQSERAKREEAAFKALYLPGYLAGGGTAKELDVEWDDIWRREKIRRGDHALSLKHHQQGQGYQHQL